MKRAVATDEGAAAVEFAFVFVLLMTLILLILQGGVLFMHQASVSAAAREGARMYAITGETDAAIDAAEDAYPFTSSSFSAVPGGSCSTPPDRSVEVTMTVTVQPSVFLGIFDNPTLTGVGAMRCGG